MADSGAHPPGPGARLRAAQLGWAWISGSVFMGTVAVIFLHAPSAAGPLPLAPSVLPRCPRVAFGTYCPGPSLFQLTPLARLAVFVLVVLLFVALGVLGWRTAAASWLTGDTRARLLWAVLVGLGGLAGWSFAAVVTFAAGFGTATQLILAYLGGGLPFALVAAMLLRPWQVNAAAVAVSAALVGAGFLMVAGRSAVYPQNVFALYADYARSFLGGPTVVLY